MTVHAFKNDEQMPQLFEKNENQKFGMKTTKHVFLRSH